MMTNKWIRRKLNSSGYGIQSPNDFYFVQHVLREKYPYYAYTALEYMAETYEGRLPCYANTINNLLFRLTNHVHPNTIIEVGAGLSIFAMAMACPSAHSIAISSSKICNDTMLELCAFHPQVEVKSGDEMAIFMQHLHLQQSIDLLHIGHTLHYREVMDAALPYVTNRTLIIIEDIDNNEQKHTWWEGLMESSRTTICYDLGSVGLLFFDHTRYKNNYWINLRK